MKTLGKYEVLEELGAGAMGKVFHGRDRVLQREVAIKTISTEDADIELKQRFYREARACGRLSHPNIVTVFDLGEQQGTSYIAMEYLEGEDLRKFIDRKTFMPLEGKLQVMTEIAEGLAHAHDSRIVHRDVKPSNIFLLKSGRPKILDFGIARVFASQLTRVGNALGTPEYMAPEQIRGKETDVRSDIFSAAVVFFELLTYEHPFGESDIPRRIIQEPPKSLRALNPFLPEKLEKILSKAMAKDPAERYQTAAEFAKAIRKLGFEVMAECSVLVDQALEDRERILAALETISKLGKIPWIEKRLQDEHIDVSVVGKINPEMAGKTNADLHYFSLSNLAKDIGRTADVLADISKEIATRQEREKLEAAKREATLATVTASDAPTIGPAEVKQEKSEISPELLATRERIAALLEEDIDKCLAEIEILPPALANDSVIDSYWVRALSMRNAQQAADAAAKVQAPPPAPPPAPEIQAAQPTVLASTPDVVEQQQPALPEIQFGNWVGLLHNRILQGDPKYLAGVGVAVVLILVIAIYTFSGRTAQKTPAADASKATAGAAAASAPSAATAPETPQATVQKEEAASSPSRPRASAPADFSKDLAQAQSAFNDGNYDTVIAVCDKILRAQPTNKQASELKKRAVNAKAFEDRFK